MNNKRKEIQNLNFKWGVIFERVGKFWTFGVLFLIVAIFAIIEPKMLSVLYWSSTINYLTEILLLAMAETFVIITAGIDLSVGAVEGAVGVATAMIIKSLVPIVGVTNALIIGTILGLAMGAIVGMINGVIVTKLKITPMIATLGTMSMVKGLGFVLCGGVDVVGLPLEMGRLGNLEFFHFISLPTLIAIAVAIICVITITKTKFGIYTYSVGSNMEASRRMGIKVDRHLIIVYMIAGLISALAGILMVFRFNIGSPVTGMNVNLNAIAAVVIGGTSPLGGTGSHAGSIIGAGIIAILVTGMVMLSINPYWQYIALGAIVVAAVFIDQIKDQRK